MAFDLIRLMWPSTRESLREVTSRPSSPETRFLVRRPKTDQRPSVPLISADIFCQSVILLRYKMVMESVLTGFDERGNKANQGRRMVYWYYNLPRREKAHWFDSFSPGLCPTLPFLFLLFWSQMWDKQVSDLLIVICPHLYLCAGSFTFKWIYLNYLSLFYHYTTTVTTLKE